MSEDLLKDIKGQILLLRNDVLLMQRSIDKMDERIRELAKNPAPSQNTLTDQSIENIFGNNTRIEKF